jgi:hypothetical protein
MAKFQEPLAARSKDATSSRPPDPLDHRRRLADQSSGRSHARQEDPVGRKNSHRRAARLAAAIYIAGAVATGCQRGDEHTLRARISAIWNQGRIDLIDTHYSEEIAPQLTEQVESTRRFYPDLEMTLTSIAIDDELYFFRWTVTGTHAKYRKKVELRGVTHGRIRDGKVVEEQIVYDRLEEADQLGFMVRSPSEY